MNCDGDMHIHLGYTAFLIVFIRRKFSIYILLLFLSKLYPFKLRHMLHVAEINAQLPISLTFKNNINQIDIHMTIIFIKEML